MFLESAYGMAQPGEGGSPFPIFLFIIIFAIFYLLVFRPQQRKAKERKELLSNLKAGDRVVTSGGLHGKIIGLTDTIVTLEIADKVRVKVSRNQISGLSDLKPIEPKKKK